MQAWEEKVYERMEGREEGHIEEKVRIIRKKLEKGLTVEEIADLLETEEPYIRQISELLSQYPEEQDKQIAERFFASTKSE